MYILHFTFLFSLFVFVTLFSYMDQPGTWIILDKKYNIANSSYHFGSYGSIWTGPSPKQYYMDLRSFCPYNIFLVTDWCIYCHMTLSAINYLLYVWCLMKFCCIAFQIKHFRCFKTRNGMCAGAIYKTEVASKKNIGYGQVVKHWRHEYYNAYVNALRIQLSKLILSV